LSTTVQGNLEKLRVRHQLDDSVVYTLVCGEQEVSLGDAVGQPIRLFFSGTIKCTHCGRLTRKSFAQGYCYPCFQRLAQCDSCIMAPEKCHFRQGTCREPEWATTHCLVPHIVYLANSSGLKVGITRATQIPTRWIDQGAVQAVPLFRVSERRIAGLVESALRHWVGDRTQWQRMLMGNPEPIDMAAAAAALKSQAAVLLGELQEQEGIGCMEDLPVTETQIRYPVLTYPARIKSLNPEKTPVIEGTLLGMKGQYLILDSGCLNIRKYTAYQATITLSWKDTP
jgi:hypothetical protein